MKCYNAGLEKSKVLLQCNNKEELALVTMQLYRRASCCYNLQCRFREEQLLLQCNNKEELALVTMKLYRRASCYNAGLEKSNVLS